MTEAEAIKAYGEMLPVETIRPEVTTGVIRRFDMPVHLVYKGPGALLTRVFLVFEMGEKSLVEYPIEMLKLCENAK